MTSSAIECEDVSIQHETGRAPTLSDISFSVAAGENVALLGLNGTGKTTLLTALVGLVPFEGRISICREALTRHSAPALRRKVGFLFSVPEDQLLFPTVREDVAFGLTKSGVSKQDALQRVDSVLGDFGIDHLADEVVHHLSHGQKQRVALAGAMVADPLVLLLDEPTSGLDPLGRKRLAEVLLGLDAAQLVATHDLDFAESISSRFVLLENGTIAEETRRIDDIRKRWGL